MSFPRLYAIVDADVAAGAGYTVRELAAAYLRGGARLLQVRAKQAGGAAFLVMVEQVLADARAHGARVVVNDRADIAAIAGADGVHVGQEDLRVADVRRAFPAVPLIGLSTHSMAQVKAALGDEPGYVAVGPVYGTGTKDTGYAPVGLELVRFARATAGNRPVVAIGGITLDRAPEVIAAGASAVAVISDLLAGDPEARVRAYVQHLG